MRTFGTRGTVQPDRHYVVPRTEEVQNFISRIKDGRYIVLFAPRQTGKTTFFPIGIDDPCRRGSNLFPDSVGFSSDAQHRFCCFLRPPLPIASRRNRDSLPKTGRGPLGGPCAIFGEYSTQRCLFNEKVL